MDIHIQEDNDPWDNIVVGDGLTCLVQSDYLAEGVEVDVGDDEDIRYSLDRKDSSCNAAKDMVGIQAEDPHEESKEDPELLKIFTRLCWICI